MEESALVAKAEKYLKEISNDSISLDNIEEFENFKRLYYKLDDRLNSLQELKENMDAQGYTTPFTSLNKYGTKAIAEVSLEEMSENSRHNQMFRMKANAKKNVLGFGDLTTPTAILAIIGLIILLILEVRKVKGGVILAIILTTLIGIPMGVTKIPTSFLAAPGNPTDMIFNIDVMGALNIKYLPFLFALFIPDFFSTFGTVIGVGAKAGLLDKNGNLPGIEKCFYVDSISTVLGSLFCMPCMTTYLESASGVEAGGKTGLTAVATSFIFILMFLITPLALMIPSAATAPTLILMGVKMLGGMKNINYEDTTECVPAFLSVALTIFTNNVANGIAAAIIVYVILKIASGKHKELPLTMYPFAAVLCYYFYTLTM